MRERSRKRSTRRRGRGGAPRPPGRGTAHRTETRESSSGGAILGSGGAARQPESADFIAASPGVCLCCVSEIALTSRPSSRPDCQARRSAAYPCGTQARRNAASRDGSTAECNGISDTRHQHRRQARQSRQTPLTWEEAHDPCPAATHPPGPLRPSDLPARRAALRRQRLSDRPGDRPGERDAARDRKSHLPQRDRSAGGHRLPGSSRATRRRRRPGRRALEDRLVHRCERRPHLPGLEARGRGLRRAPRGAAGSRLQDRLHGGVRASHRRLRIRRGLSRSERSRPFELVSEVPRLPRRLAGIGRFQGCGRERRRPARLGHRRQRHRRAGQGRRGKNGPRREGDAQLRSGGGRKAEAAARQRRRGSHSGLLAGRAGCLGAPGARRNDGGGRLLSGLPRCLPAGAGERPSRRAGTGPGGILEPGDLCTGGRSGAARRHRAAGGAPGLGLERRGPIGCDPIRGQRPGDLVPAELPGQEEPDRLAHPVPALGHQRHLPGRSPARTGHHADAVARRPGEDRMGLRADRGAGQIGRGDAHARRHPGRGQAAGSGARTPQRGEARRHRPGLPEGRAGRHPRPAGRLLRTVAARPGTTSTTT